MIWYAEGLIDHKSSFIWYQVITQTKDDLVIRHL